MACAFLDSFCLGMVELRQGSNWPEPLGTFLGRAEEAYVSDCRDLDNNSEKTSSMDATMADRDESFLGTSDVVAVVLRYNSRLHAWKLLEACKF
jgi:hypothetical protein